MGTTPAVDAQVAAASSPTRAPRSPGSRSRQLWSEYWPLLALGVLAILVSVAVHHWIFPAYSWNRDEPVYLWQVHALRDGHFLPTDGGTPAFFQPWLSGHGDGFFFSQYTLGWPLVLLVGNVVFGTAAAALAFGTVLAVVGTYAFARTVTADRTMSLTAAALMLASPILMIQSGVYLGYLFVLGLGLVFAAALVTGFEQRRPWLLVAAGAMVGWIFMTRPFDALLWAAAAGSYVLVVHRREWKRLLRALLWAGAGALPLVIATLAYNRHVTGSFAEFPITAADPLDKFGFGLRRLMPTIGAADYTVGVAFRSAGKNGLALPLFLFGSYIGVVVAGFGLWYRRRQRTTLALLLLAIAFPLGYFFFWGLHVSATNATLSGPIYFTPLFAPLVVLIAVAIVTWWRHRPAVGAVAVVVLALVTVPFAVNRLDVNHRISAAQIPWRDGTERVRGPAVVFVQQSGPYLLLLNPFSSNTADLDGRILWSTDQGAADLELIEQHPERTPYLQQTSVPPNKYEPTSHPTTPTVITRRLHVVEAGVVTVRTRVTNTTDEPVVVVSLQVGDHVERRTVATASRRGDAYDVEWQVAAPYPTVASPGAVPLPAGLGEATITAGFGATEATATKPAARGVIPFRAGDQAQLLLPARAASHRAQGWVEVLDAPELRVKATV